MEMTEKPITLPLSPCMSVDQEVKLVLAAQHVVNEAMAMGDERPRQDIAHGGYSTADAWALLDAVERDVWAVERLVDPKQWMGKL